MKKPPVTAQCVFDSDGPELGETVLTVFRLWLRRRLERPPGPCPDGDGQAAKGPDAGFPRKA